jgi:uncharacterized protein
VRISWLALAISTSALAAPPRDAPIAPIDAHAHIGRFRGYDLSLPTLLDYLDRAHVEAALISNIDGAALPGTTADLDERTINEETARIAAANPRLWPLAWARPGAPGASASAIEPFLRDRHFRGIKFHPEFNAFSPSDPAVVPYLRLCEKYHVPALFHSGAGPRSGPAALHALARRFPTVPFVLYHMGFGTTHDEAIAAAKSARRTGDALLYLETAQVDPEDALRAVREVGADRVLFGTDAPYFGRDHTAQTAPLLDALRRLPAAQSRPVLRDNALHLFRRPAGS